MPTVREAHDVLSRIALDHGALIRRSDREVAALRAAASSVLAPVLHAAREVATERLVGRASLDALARAGDPGPRDAYSRAITRDEVKAREVRSEVVELRARAHEQTLSASCNDREALEMSAVAARMFPSRLTDMRCLAELRAALGSAQEDPAAFLVEVLGVVDRHRASGAMARLVDRPMRAVEKEARDYGKRTGAVFADDARRIVGAFHAIADLTRQASVGRAAAERDLEAASHAEELLAHLPDAENLIRIAREALVEGMATRGSAIALQSMAADLFVAGHVATVARSRRLLDVACGLEERVATSRLLLERVQQPISHLKRGKASVPRRQVKDVNLSALRAASDVMLLELTTHVAGCRALVMAAAAIEREVASTADDRAVADLIRRSPSVESTWNALGLLFTVQACQASPGCAVLPGFAAARDAVWRGMDGYGGNMPDSISPSRWISAILTCGLDPFASSLLDGSARRGVPPKPGLHAPVPDLGDPGLRA